jgi:excisionase family DNA binding protein
MKKTILIQMSPEQLDGKFQNVTRLIKSRHESVPLVTEDEIYYTRKQVAEKFHVQLSTIHNWVQKGILIRHGIGNRVYFKKSELEKALVPIKS